MLWQIGLGDSVNNITDAVIRAVYEDCHFEKKDLFFQQAEKVSPYIETAFTYLNTKHVNNKKIEVNVLCRYAETSAELLHRSTIDTKEKKELCDFVIDTLVHYLSQIDLRSGLSKKEYIGRLLKMEILNGEFGQKAAENFKKIRKANQFSLALSLSKMYYAGSSVNQFRLVTVRIFPLCSIYRNNTRGTLTDCVVVHNFILSCPVIFLYNFFLYHWQHGISSTKSEDTHLEPGTE